MRRAGQQATRVALLSGLVVAAWALPAVAQPVGEALPPPQASEPDEFEAVPLEQGPLPPAWQLQLGVQGGWDSNPRFDADDQEGSFQRGLQGSLLHARPVKHGHLGFRFNASTRAYERNRQQDRRTFGGELAWLRRLSTRSTLQLQDGVSSSYSRDDQALVADGQLLPETHVFRNTAGLSLSHLLSDVQSLRVRLRHELVDFRDEELVDAQQSFLSLTWRRRLDAQRSVDLGYGLERSDPAERPGAWRHAALLGYRTRLRQELFLNGAAGLVAFRVDQEPTWRVHPRFEAASSLRRRSVSATLSYLHTVNQAYGFGRERIADVASLFLSKQWRPMSAAIGYSFSRSRDPGLAEDRTTTHSFDTGLRRSFSRNVVASVNYSLRRWLRDEPGGSYTSQVVALSLSYAKAWN
jgi:hypothetical protein